jgi:hypothetical protein
MKANAQVPPDQKPDKPKSRFRLEITRHNHRVVITDSIDKGRYRSYVISYYIEGNFVLKPLRFSPTRPRIRRRWT